VGSTPGSGVTLPEIGKIASAYGVPYMRCENRSEAARVIAEALAAPGPLLCEVMARYDQQVLPAVPSRLLPDGSMRSQALHEMTPDLGIDFAAILAEAQGRP
jgi:acetolactate synthase I/II/III large subunit